MSVKVWAKESWPELVMLGAVLAAGQFFVARAEAAGAAKASGLEHRLDRIERTLERIEDRLLGVPP